MFYVYGTEKTGKPYEPGSLESVRKRRVGATGPVAGMSQVSNVSDRQALSEESSGKIQSDSIEGYEEVLEQRREKVLYVYQIMTKRVISVDPEASLHTVWDLFRQHRFRHVPVVKDGSLKGILSDRDVLPYMTLWKADPADAEVPEAQKVHSIPVLTVRPEAEIKYAARMMLKEHVGALPVVDDSHNLVGLITRTDILRAVIRHAPLELWV